VGMTSLPRGSARPRAQEAPLHNRSTAERSPSGERVHQRRGMRRRGHPFSIRHGRSPVVLVAARLAVDRGWEGKEKGRSGADRIFSGGDLTATVTTAAVAFGHAVVKDEDRMRLGLGNRIPWGVLCHRNPRVTVGSMSTGEIERWLTGPKGAQAGRNFPGPGPGCGLGAGSGSPAGAAGPRAFLCHWTEHMATSWVWVGSAGTRGRGRVRLGLACREIGPWRFLQNCARAGRELVFVGWAALCALLGCTRMNARQRVRATGPQRGCGL
jgi:hypothetical protein